MKTTWIAELTLLAGVTVCAAECGGQERPTVTVYQLNTHLVPAVELQRAQSLGTKMFDGIGINLQWRNGMLRPISEESECSRSAVAIQMRLDHDEPGHPRAMAYAFPFGGGSGQAIHVLWDRVREASSQESSGRLLGHVMVHEITHILEGMNHHSASGVMKAGWTSHDYFLMGGEPLPFAPEDVELIQLGFLRWPARRGASPGPSLATAAGVARLP
jgi:hypothetical protein